MYAGAGKPQIGVQAVFDDAEFNRRMEAMLKNLDRLDKKLEDLADASERSADRRKKAEEGAFKTLSRAIHNLRWELVTFLYLNRVFTRGIKNAFAVMEEAGKGAAERMGTRALARRLETDLGTVSAQVRQTNQEVMSVGESYQVVLQGMLIDQGQFSSQYARLWEAARVAAVVGLTDADTAFKAFITDLRDGTGAATDAISPIYGVANALEDYARATGRTVEQLSNFESAQITMRQVYSETNRLLREGAQEALDAAAQYDQLKAAWADLKQVGGELVQSSGLLPAMTLILRDMAKAAVLVAAGIGAATEEFTKFGKAFDLGSFALLFGQQIAFGAAGAPSEPFEKLMKRYAEAMGYYSDQVNKSQLDYEKMRAKTEEVDYGPLVDHLLKRERLEEDHRNRLLKLQRQYNTRVDRIERRHQINVDRIHRSAQMDRDRAIRSYNRRRAAMEDRRRAAERDLEAEHLLKLEQNRREYMLREMQSEAMYQYERSVLFARGDVLAIEDLDARNALEKEARRQNFEEQQRQERENYALRLQQQKDQFKEQLEDLKAMLDEQLKEISIREAERVAEAAIRREEELAEARKNYQEQVDAEKESHKRSLDAWAEYWVKLAQKFDLGLEQIKTILRTFLGSGGEVDNIMTAFETRWQEYMSKLAQMKALLESMKRSVGSLWPQGRGVGIPGRDFPFQYGGGGFFSSPTSIRVGEHGTEMVSISPMTSLTNVNVRWVGGAIPIQGSGLEGANLSGLGDTIAQGLLVGLERGLTRAGATYG